MKKFFLFVFVVFFFNPALAFAQRVARVPTAGRMAGAEAVLDVHDERIGVTEQAVVELSKQLEELRKGDRATKEQIKDLLRKANEGCWAVKDAAAQTGCFNAIKDVIAAAGAQAGIDKDVLRTFESVVRQDRLPRHKVTTTPGAAGAPATTIEESSYDEVDVLNLAALGLGGKVVVERTQGASERLGLPGTSLSLRYEPPRLPPALRYKAMKAATGGSAEENPYAVNVWGAMALGAIAGGALGCGIGGTAQPEKVDQDGFSRSGCANWGLITGASTALLTGVVVGVWNYATTPE